MTLITKNQLDSWYKKEKSKIILPDIFLDLDDEQIEKNNCICCDGTGLFIHNAGTIDESEEKCVCQINEDRE